MKEKEFKRDRIKAKQREKVKERDKERRSACVFLEAFSKMKGQPLLCFMSNSNYPPLSRSYTAHLRS